MGANPGLRDVCHSITGGSISAQGKKCHRSQSCLKLTTLGYWIPFEAAKAVAARLCYSIRYVLVPVFGPDFVALCHRKDDPDYNNLAIDRNVIQRCIQRATATQQRSRGSSMVRSPQVSSPYAALPIWPPPKSLRPKPLKPMDIESGYGTDTDRSEIGPGSPTSIAWTPVNTPRMKNFDSLRSTTPQDVTSSPSANGTPTNGPRPSPSKRPWRDEASEENSLHICDSSSMLLASPKRQRDPSSYQTPEMEAAHTLMQLRMADAKVGKKKTVRRRRASA